MILVLTDAFDPHADHVEQKLRQRGADFVRFDPAQFPANAEVSLSYTVNGEDPVQACPWERTCGAKRSGVRMVSSPRCVCSTQRDHR